MHIYIITSYYLISPSLSRFAPRRRREKLGSDHVETLRSKRKLAESLGAETRRTGVSYGIDEVLMWI